jgi:hypothetical protein
VVCLAWLGAGTACAAENGVSVYPTGVETVFPGRLPAHGQTILLQFDNFYQANSLRDGAGRSEVPGFHLRVAAVAFKVVHNWGVHFLGGELASSAAVPFVYQHLDVPFGRFQKFGVANIDLGVLDVTYKRGSLYWWYGFDVFTPGLQYNQSDVLNVGQHYWAGAPAVAVSWLPNHAKSEVSWRTNYIVSGKNGATGYHSGDELEVDYAAMQNVTKELALGVNGYLDHQTTGDTINGLLAGGDGKRMRVVSIGPQIRYHLGHVGLIAKYQREFLVQNRTCGNAFWFQIGIPVGRRE